MSKGITAEVDADPRADVVARQYERWRYPQPIQDVGGWLRTNWEWFDPSHAHRLFWPDRGYKADADILIAGCGTNQAAVLAFTNPQARVVGVDVSQASLDHQQHLKDKHGLGNLQLHRLPIERVATLGCEFDLIVSTGVLHHMAEPLAGITALGECLRPDGALGVMVYARYGRYGVELLQSVFRDIGLGQDEASLRKVRETLALLPPDHPVRGYAKIARNLNADAVLLDTFLHGREQSFTVDDCVKFTEAAGLVFQSWLLKAPYYAHDLFAPSSGFYSTMAQLPERTQWSVMERLYTRNACHFFIATRPERPPASYAIDFSAPESLDYVPMMRQRCGLSGTEIFRPGWRAGLASAQLPFIQHVDGESSIRQIAAAVSESGAWPRADLGELEEYARTLFRSLWRMDFVAMGLG
jgi:SAM-dependent methyltransferase